ncbi:MAG TPA: hypothetical protein DEB40_06255 [Elusimicrobia bacterium]|nr:hypothetical protein [Elusimicrobiota bacterium]HBT61329.1 hypothetical protein [Elusimicrobiota bacterium]
MVWRRSPVPEALLGQAQACVLVAARTASFFQAPTAANAFSVHEARLAARRLRERTQAALKGLCRDWQTLSRLFDAAAQQAAAGAAEGYRFNISAAGGWAAMAGGLRDATRDLAEALAAVQDGRRCEALIVTAKRRAAEVERLRRGARTQALNEPNVVVELKERTVLRRLSQSAEACQQAADCMAEVLEARA